jgi:hypothetical protein
METNSEMENLKRKYEKFHFEILEDYRGTKSFEEIKDLLTRFENDVAPIVELFSSDPRYYLEKTALLVCYASSNLYRDLDKKEKFTEDLLTTSGYTEEEKKSISNIINKRRNRLEILACLRTGKRLETESKDKQI